MPSTRPLDPIEIRVLGTLLEKEQTTPDHYPMTINGLINACNQKTNREPVTSLTETEVVEALDRLRLDVLTWRSEGARAERWEQRLDRRWHLTPPRKAIMTLLLLRGAQTPGELKTRSDRMHSFESVARWKRRSRSWRSPARISWCASCPRRRDSARTAGSTSPEPKKTCRLPSPVALDAERTGCTAGSVRHRTHRSAGGESRSADGGASRLAGSSGGSGGVGSGLARKGQTPKPWILYCRSVAPTPCLGRSTS